MSKRRVQLLRMTLRKNRWKLKTNYDLITTKFSETIGHKSVTGPHKVTVAECREPGPKLLDRDSQLIVLRELPLQSELDSATTSEFASKVAVVFELQSLSLVCSILFSNLHINKNKEHKSSIISVNAISKILQKKKWHG